MMITFSRHGADPGSGGAQDAIGYLLSDRVPKPATGNRRRMEVRDPAPELLLGDPIMMRAALRAAPGAHVYRSGVLSFAPDDVDVVAFNRGDAASRRAIDLAAGLVLETAYCGIPPRSRPPVLMTTHTHTGRLEVNVLLPRWVARGGGGVRSFNPDPPGRASRDVWDAAQDLLNARFGWADPRDPARARLVRSPDWIQKERASFRRDGGIGRQDRRERLARALRDAVAAGRVRCRQDVLAWLQARGSDEGFVVHAVTEAHVTIGPRAAPPARRQRLTGPLFAAGFVSPEAVLATPDDIDARRHARRQVVATAPMRWQTAWARRAAFARDRYGCGTWPEPACPLGDWLGAAQTGAPRLIPAMRFDPPSRHDEEMTDAAPLRHAYPDGTTASPPGAQTRADAGAAPRGAGPAHRGAGGDRGGSRGRDRRLDRYARALAGPDGPGRILAHLTERLRACGPVRAARRLLAHLGHAIPEDLPTSLRTLETTLESLNDQLFARLRPDHLPRSAASRPDRDYAGHVGPPRGTAPRPAEAGTEPGSRRDRPRAGGDGNAREGRLGTGQGGHRVAPAGTAGWSAERRGDGRGSALRPDGRPRRPSRQDRAQGDMPRQLGGRDAPPPGSRIALLREITRIADATGGSRRVLVRFAVDPQRPEAASGPALYFRFDGETWRVTGAPATLQVIRERFGGDFAGPDAALASTQPADANTAALEPPACAESEGGGPAPDL